MERAIIEAQKVKKDIPVGAVIIRDGDVIASCHNLKEENQDVTSHAEILAIKEAQKKLGTWHLDDCDMYVTLEPCPMCGWAILQSRIRNLYFGSYDPKYGSFSTDINLKKVSGSSINIYGGIQEDECDMLLKRFFKHIR